MYSELAEYFRVFLVLRRRIVPEKSRPTLSTRFRGAHFILAGKPWNKLEYSISHFGIPWNTISYSGINVGIRLHIDI